MTLSFDKTQAKGMFVQLGGYLDRLRAGFEIDKGTIRSVAGSLNWYAEVLQSGRMHIRSWWLYHKFHSTFNLIGRKRLIDDTVWWRGVLQAWSDDGVANVEYPTLTVEELLRDDGSLWVVQSDASGPDGFGYLHGDLNMNDPHYYSQKWSETYFFVNSHNGELQALLHFVRNTEIRSVMLIWVSDCLAAVWSLNKGRCFDGVGMVTLSSILLLCDEKRLQLLPLWIPRELNEFADYLSHLARYRDEHSSEGRVSGLSVPAGNRGEDSSQEISKRILAPR